jgi:NAD(P)-dependent dehydrogenase (short-subunit alcohol dehydrogenase family)
LVKLLMDRLRASSPSRVVILGSGLHKGMPGQPPVALDFDDLAIAKGHYVGVNAYARSKLANILFAYELDRRERGNGVNANVVSPKIVPATVVRHSKGFQRFMMQYVMPLLPIARTAEQAAENTVFAALDPSLKGIGGLYLEDQKPIRSSPASYDEASAKRLWEISEELTRG